MAPRRAPQGNRQIFRSILLKRDRRLSVCCPLTAARYDKLCTARLTGFFSFSPRRLSLSMRDGCRSGASLSIGVDTEPALSAMLGCAAFMIVFAAGASLASYLLVTIAGPRIDGLLAEADAVVGFNWPSTMAFAADYPPLNRMLGLAYLSAMPQMVLLLLWFGTRGDPEDFTALRLPSPLAPSSRSPSGLRFLIDILGGFSSPSLRS